MEFIETCFLPSVVIYNKSVTVGGSTEHSTTNDSFKSVPMENMVCKLRNPCRNLENVEVMVWAKAIDT